MKISDIGDHDAKNILQLKNILKRTVTELTFSLSDAKVVDETINWFDKFVAFCTHVQKSEHDAKKKPMREPEPKQADDFSSLKIKDFSPGKLPAKSTKIRNKKTKGKK